MRGEHAGQSSSTRSKVKDETVFKGRDLAQGSQNISLIILAGNQRLVFIPFGFVDFFLCRHEAIIIGG